MSFLFGKGANKGAKPADLVKALKDSMTIVVKEKEKSKIDKAAEEVSKCLAVFKGELLGEGEPEPNQEVITQLANEVYQHDLIPLLVLNLTKIEFEAKKDLAIVLGILLRRQVGQRFVTVEYIARNPQLLESLVVGYDNADIALNCGAILRECVRHEPLARLILYSENFFKFFGYVELPNFDIASDSFATLKELLTAHKPLVAEFLEKHYDQVFEHYAKLLHSENYVTKRQSLKLLGELLLDRANFVVMTRYISHAANLKLMMNLLRDKSRSIQYEAFHVFKVFVANPNKPKAILDILVQNKDKLLKFLGKFHNDRDDEQFNDEKAYLLKQIEQLQV